MNDDLPSPAHGRVLDILTRYVDVRFEGSDKVRRAEREADLRAVDVARTALETRLEGMNEFRKQILDERANYVSLAVYHDHVDDVTRTHDSLEGRLRQIETQSANMQGRIWMFGVIATAAGGLVGAVLASLVSRLGH